ncbi:hypothetical protein [Pseudomonas syringae]|uniref:hypothetical protein n=1 Tax=Pseudomonas syringae TaxID=317 RepID=UPI0011AF483E|nr:hypothetical protein [Pseudomonas syringae]MCF5732950.1 hypothetical protein [Pseudomonas syringae]MCF5738825.1 hypothetical protein [Pseudomonas syringae]MCF5751830.1 hypothetical protein [Pseudomonas syringae]MCF5757851.1 hypothetical protein [Pseudomonas syringae]MDF5830537.1 hypothetical protein [Pseudomonas syringae]
MFRALANSICMFLPAVFVDETHGAYKANVEFTSSVGNSERCEVSDLLIVSYHHSEPARATFWQAKKQKSSKWQKYTSELGHLDFDGQYNQWDLLSRRPSIKGVGGFSPPTTLLSSFSSAIGSFGVFYFNGISIEVNHSTAEFVSCLAPSSSKSKMHINGIFSNYFSPSNDLISRPTIESFLHALTSHQIGAEMDFRKPEHKWLLNYILSKLPASGGGQDIANVFRNRHSEVEAVRIDDSKNDGISILLVGADSNF